MCHHCSWLSRTTICASRWLPRASPTLNQSQPFPVLIFPGRVRPPVQTQSKSVNSYLCSHESVGMKRCRTCSWLFRMTICASRFEQLTDSSFPRYKFSRSRPRPGTKPARFSQPLIATPDTRQVLQVLDMALAVFAERGGGRNFMALQDATTANSN